MTTKFIQPFRLLDLPGEIRNKIYQAILCCFDPAPTPLRPSEICPATHSIETAILRTCKQIHREAYDIMVKTNRFIKVTTIDIPMYAPLMLARLPIVTLDRAYVESFQGYVMSLTLNAPSGGRGGHADYHAPPVGTDPHSNFMILGRDWDKFCILLSKADMYMEDYLSLGTGVHVNIHLNAYPTQLPTYKAPITEFFTQRNQEALLKPFRTHITRFFDISITGTVAHDLADSIKNQVCEFLWTDPEQVLRHLKAAKTSADALFSAQDTTAATTEWAALATEMYRIEKTSTWNSLLERGGPDFITAWAEIQFKTSLNHAHGQLLAMQLPNTEPFSIRLMGLQVVRNLKTSVDLVDKARTDGSSYVPPTLLTAKRLYRQALAWRLAGQTAVHAPACLRMLGYAVEDINGAAMLAPQDAVILSERNRISAWERSVTGNSATATGP